MTFMSEVEAAFNAFYSKLRLIKRNGLDKEGLRRLQGIEDRLIDLVAMMELGKTPSKEI